MRPYTIYWRRFQFSHESFPLAPCPKIYLTRWNLRRSSPFQQPSDLAGNATLSQSVPEHGTGKLGAHATVFLLLDALLSTGFLYVCLFFLLPSWSSSFRYLGPPVSGSIGNFTVSNLSSMSFSLYDTQSMGWPTSDSWTQQNGYPRPENTHTSKHWISFAYWVIINRDPPTF